MQTSQVAKFDVTDLVEGTVIAEVTSFFKDVSSKKAFLGTVLESM